MLINVDSIKSFLLDELFLDWVWDSKVNVEDFIDKHFDDFVFVSFEILLDFADFLLGLFLKSGLKLLIFFLIYNKNFTLSFILSNSASLFCLYLATYKSAAYLASLSFLCLKYFIDWEEKKWTDRQSVIEKSLPFFLGILNDVVSFLFGFEEFIDVGCFTHFLAKYLFEINYKTQIK